MIVVTGAAGFIGSNLVHALNRRGRSDIVVVDDLTDGRKFVNLVDADIADFISPTEFLRHFAQPSTYAEVELVYHLGACSDTTEWNGRLMLESNYEYSKTLLSACQARDIGLIYASSAAVYGASRICIETAAHERPLNVYGYSKLLFDRYVRHRLASARAPIIGLRYFNVYGPREQHKARMASVVWHFNQQMQAHARVKLFGASHGVESGEQRRDFIHVEDAVAVTLWCGEQRTASGIYNCGTGGAASFNDVANAVLAWHQHGRIEYIPFPADLLAAYQSHTCADLGNLRTAGFHGEFQSVQSGIKAYLDWLNR
ncbi:MAG: ADP-glyceromanno-heptose 6-epimerase [Gammaproteobacteria bacterium]|nr:ADP-glyceromanno-heptose 6-epimerase [Gammaproteobacteria bacterium]